MVYIICNRTDLLDYILSGIENKFETTIININDECSFFQRFLRKIIPNYISYPQLFLGKELRNILKNITCNDKVIIIDYTNMNLLKAVSELVPDSTSKYLWMWNPLKNENSYHLEKLIRNIKSINFKICTFDKKDSKKYELILLKQFYKMNQINLKNDLILNDFYFLGFVKSRSSEIENLKKTLAEFKVLFHVVTEKNQVITYAENVENIKRTKCIIDLVQKGQEGMTLRPLEAIAFRKKILTNNLNIVTEDFYNSKNIFVLGINDLKNLKDFLKADFCVLEDSIIEKYDVNTWINKFV